MSEERDKPDPEKTERDFDLEHYRPRNSDRWVGTSLASPRVAIKFAKMLQGSLERLPKEQRRLMVDLARRTRTWRQGAAIATNAEASCEDGTNDEVVSDDVLSAEALADDEAPETMLPPLPPPWGEALIGLLCGREMREAMLGDLEEKFAELAERRGARKAKAWYWGQAARSALFFAVRWGRRLLELEAILKRIL